MRAKPWGQRRQPPDTAIRRSRANLARMRPTGPSPPQACRRAVRADRCRPKAGPAIRDPARGPATAALGQAWPDDGLDGRSGIEFRRDDARDGGEELGTHVARSRPPAVVRPDQSGADHAQDTRVVREDARLPGPPLDLAIQALDRIGRRYPLPEIFRIARECRQVVGDPGERMRREVDVRMPETQHLHRHEQPDADLAPVRALEDPLGSLRAFLLPPQGTRGRRRFSCSDAAQLEIRVGQKRVDRRAKPGSAVGDDQLRAGKPAPDQRAQEDAPEFRGFGRHDPDPQDMAVAVLVDADGHCHGAAPDMLAQMAMRAGRVKIRDRPVPLQPRSWRRRRKPDPRSPRSSRASKRRRSRLPAGTRQAPSRSAAAPRRCAA